jgi:hypothetical protein
MKLVKGKDLSENLSLVYQAKLKEMIKTFLEKKYVSQDEMNAAYKKTDAEWREYAKKINSSSRIINLDKNGFEKECMKTINSLTKKPK